MTSPNLPTLLKLASLHFTDVQDLLHQAIGLIPTTTLPPGYADRIRHTRIWTEEAWAELAPIVRHPQFPANLKQEDPPMATHPVATRLRQCQALATSLRNVLASTLTLARQQNLEFNHIAAINCAIDHANSAWLQIGNIATLLQPRLEQDPP